MYKPQTLASLTACGGSDNLLNLCNMDALHALNRLESGCTLLVSLPGSYLSTTFELTPKGCKRYNIEMGTICTPWSKGEIFKHFSQMLKEGGEIIEI